MSDAFSLDIEFRLINGFERGARERQRERGYSRRERDKEWRGRWPDREARRKVKATKLKTKKAKLRSILWPVEVTGPTGGEIVALQASKPLTS